MSTPAHRARQQKPIADADVNRPRPYDLSESGEIARLHREVRGYLATCLKDHHGTDFAGRKFAMDALEVLIGKKL